MNNLFVPSSQVIKSLIQGRGCSFYQLPESNHFHLALSKVVSSPMPPAESTHYFITCAGELSSSKFTFSEFQSRKSIVAKIMLEYQGLESHFKGRILKLRDGKFELGVPILEFKFIKVALSPIRFRHFTKVGTQS